MHINLPSLSLVVLIGPSGAGKSTFARRHFLPTEVLSSGYCRLLSQYTTSEESLRSTAPPDEVGELTVALATFTRNARQNRE